VNDQPGVDPVPRPHCPRDERPIAERSRVLANRAPVGVRFLEHTADTGIEARARSLEGCFARAAAGMFGCFTAPAGSSPAMSSVDLDVSADGYEELMVAWLEELLYQSEVKGLALHDFTVENVSKSRVRGSARGPAFGTGARAVGSGVKAVTRHGLQVLRVGGYWQARVIFDV
jgi:SHS2 domain-containing protein